MKILIYSMLFFLSMVGCKPKPSYQNFITPKEIIDLGALVTEDLPEQVWGRLLNQYGFEESNSFNVINQEFENTEPFIEEIKLIN